MQYWETYLNDHRAGASRWDSIGQADLVGNRRTKWGPIIEEVAESIEQDLVVLEDPGHGQGLGGDLKKGAALLTERASRLELNGHYSPSPLSRVLELETLAHVGRRAGACGPCLFQCVTHPEWSGDSTSPPSKRRAIGDAGAGP